MIKTQISLYPGRFKIPFGADDVCWNYHAREGTIYLDIKQKGVNLSGSTFGGYLCQDPDTRLLEQLSAEFWHEIQEDVETIQAALQTARVGDLKPEAQQQAEKRLKEKVRTFLRRHFEFQEPTF